MDANALRRSYDRTAPNYDNEFRSRQFKKYRAMLAEAGEDLRTELDRGPVLDLGCGTGLLAEFLCQGFGVRNLVGLDFSRRMLACARERGVLATQGEMRRLPFADGRFAVAFGFTVLRILPDRDADSRALEEIARVLNPGGRLILTVLAASHDESLTRDLEAAGFRPTPAVPCGQDMGYLCVRG
jgi:ubiquinone/menaquinone biosynthesis C-methylase UbiE